MRVTEVMEATPSANALDVEMPTKIAEAMTDLRIDVVIFIHLETIVAVDFLNLFRRTFEVMRPEKLKRRAEVSDEFLAAKPEFDKAAVEGRIDRLVRFVPVVFWGRSEV